MDAYNLNFDLAYVCLSAINVINTLIKKYIELNYLSKYFYKNQPRLIVRTTESKQYFQYKIIWKGK